MGVDDHLELARRNHDFYEELRRDARYLDWAITVLFYVALHLVSAHAVHHGERLGENHEAIYDYTRRRLTSIKDAYRRLSSQSRDTRYRGWKPSEADVDRIYQGSFQHIEAQLRNRGTSFR